VLRGETFSPSGRGRTPKRVHPTEDRAGRAHPVDPWQRFPVVLAPDVPAGFRDGDHDAVRLVYREYGRMVFAISYRVLGRRELAEEATQQTFVQAWRGSQSFDPARELGPWLATIARRVAIDVHRREARRGARPLDDIAAADPAVVTLPPSAQAIEEVSEVRRAIDDLAPDEREVVRLQHLDGLTQTEIADRLGIPLGTVKSRSHRAHRQLAARLGHLRGEAP
jgi:RNA polymerase sigma factor (sigma-70 family)